MRDPEDSLVHSWTCWARAPAVTLQGAHEFGWSEAAAQTARGTRDPGSWGPTPCPLAIAAAVPSPGRPYPRATPPPNSPAGSSCPLDPIPPLGWLGLGCAHWLRELRGGGGARGGGAWLWPQMAYSLLLVRLSLQSTRSWCAESVGRAGWWCTAAWSRTWACCASTPGSPPPW